jgi:UDP-N-acetyl-D-glucosamine dehydrogenase
VHEGITTNPPDVEDAIHTSVGVIGLGYTGLPLAIAFAKAGLRVVGYDVDPDKIAALRQGSSYLPDISDHAVAAGLARLTPTGDPALLRDCDALVICVPTPVTRTGEAILDYVDAALDTAAASVHPGSVVVIQSTVPPGTTNAGAARLAVRTGLTPGRDLFVAMAPERIDPANRHGWTVENTPRVVGGVTAECTRRATALFSAICGHVIPVGTCEVAETAKVFENTFRLVNIALTYELAAVCADLDISPRDVLDAAATKPYGFLAHRPGPGVGGECIPVDPLFLTAIGERAGVPLPLISEAYLHVRNRPAEVVERLARVAKEHGGDLYGAHVLLAGVAYKPGVGDTRNAPAEGVVRELWLRGAVVAYSDPYVPAFEVDGVAVTRVGWDEETISAHDHVVLLTAHQQFVQTTQWRAARSILDTWHVLDRADHGPRDEQLAVL